jgi:hypothetical protein
MQPGVEELGYCAYTMSAMLLQPFKSSSLHDDI